MSSKSQKNHNTTYTHLNVNSMSTHETTNFNMTLLKGQRMGLTCLHQGLNLWCLSYEPEAFTNFATNSSYYKAIFVSNIKR